ncbi:UvrB/UvrC motif-containing protein [Cerasicoccus maritimus]|uniref:UvrB/UvrC motif-containing protein n=1 Tax=Cerasicoccus maritimus TaxID=490089 RepID=UPI0028525D8D|nr:UvrB/UvrC motif-containing protein [Cerasicoccus maritimus]
MSGKKKCVICGATAKVFINLVKTGHSAHSAYCLEHADELGLLSPGAYALLDSAETNHAEQHHNSAKCPSCGFTLRDWKRTGRFGCADCYQAFEEKIMPALKRLHTDSVHRGKIPHAAITPGLVANRIQELQRQLDSAVQEERFEDAAQTRDLMAELKSWKPHNS